MLTFNGITDQALTCWTYLSDLAKSAHEATRFARPEDAHRVGILIGKIRNETFQVYKTGRPGNRFYVVKVFNRFWKEGGRYVVLPECP